MAKRYFSMLMALCFIVIANAPAVAKQKKKSKTDIKLVEAYTKRTIPGIPNAPVKTSYNFIIVWQASTYPQSFFWRGENGWLTCSIAKAHKTVTRKGQSVDYTAIPVNNGDIHKGDTLQLVPVPGGKFPIPADVPASAKNTLYYKTGNSGWLSFPVKNIDKRPDAAMP